MKKLKAFCMQQRNLLAEAQIGEVVNNLRRSLERINSDRYQDVINFSFRLRSNQNEHSKKLITAAEYNMILAQILNALLDFVDEIEETPEIQKLFERYATEGVPDINTVAVTLTSNDPRVFCNPITLYDDASIGRGNHCDIVISDQRISWGHARIIIEGSKVSIEDLASRNGTFVNERRIYGHEIIVSECRISFYNVHFDLKITPQNL